MQLKSPQEMDPVVQGSLKAMCTIVDETLGAINRMPWSGQHKLEVGMDLHIGVIGMAAMMLRFSSEQQEQEFVSLFKTFLTNSRVNYQSDKLMERLSKGRRQ